MTEETDNQWQSDSGHFDLDQSTFERALDCSGLGFWDQDFVHNRVVRNSKWAEMLGYTPSDIGHGLERWHGLIHPDDMPAVLETAAAHEGGRTENFSVEHRMRTRDGDWRWIHNWGRVVDRDGDGRPLRALGFHRDVTDQKETEAALRHSETKYRSVVERSADNIFLMDVSSRRIIEANRALGNLLGYSAHELTGLAVYDILGAPPEDVDKQIEIAVSFGSHFMGERMYRRRNGSLIPVEVSITCLRLGDEQVFSVVSRDISRRKLAESQTQQALRDLESQVKDRTQELERMSRQLEAEREALDRKNLALREVLSQIESNRTITSRRIQANVDKLAHPLLSQLEAEDDPQVKQSAQLLRRCLIEIVSPFMEAVSSELDCLSPREMQVCDMVRKGMKSREIADVFGTSLETVRKQRAVIRRKLGLTNSKSNLGSYLRRFGHTD